MTSATWGEFIDILSTEILPIYQAHEQSFDGVGIHSRMHVSRAVIFAERLSRYYLENFDASLDVNAVRVATAFHDSGREGNGVDLWEQDSADLCRAFLINKGVDPDRAKFTGDIILKHSRNCLEKRIMHDADVLEIMRPVCGHGGRYGFWMKKLRFANFGDPFFEHSQEAVLLREKIVDEAWQFISETEKVKNEFNHAQDYFGSVLQYLDENRTSLPFWSQIV